MKAVVKVAVALLSLSAVSAFAGQGTMICKQWGYTDNPEHFHDIKVLSGTHNFEINGSRVTYAGKTFKSMDPEFVDMQGLAITYFNFNNDEVLYIYENEKGEQEVGISKLEDDSDTMFADKALYTDCSVEEQTVVRTNWKGAQTSLPVFRF